MNDITIRFSPPDPDDDQSEFCISLRIPDHKPIYIGWGKTLADAQLDAASFLKLLTTKVKSKKIKQQKYTAEGDLDD